MCERDSVSIGCSNKSNSALDISSGMIEIMLS